MSIESGTEPVPTPCEEEEERQPVVEREYTTGGKLRKMTLKTLLLLFVFSLGFILGGLCFTDHTADQADNSQQFAYVYDTEQKVEDFYTTIFERPFSEKTGLPPESPEVKEYMTAVREGFGRPLVAVEAFAIFVNPDGDKFSVHDNLLKENALLLPLVELKVSEQSKRLRLFSSQEKGVTLPRFNAQFTYSKDGIYERGHFAVCREDGAPERMYFDSKGIGIFDVMIVFEHEHGVRFTYSLNNLTWELVDEQWYSEEEKNRVDGLLEDYKILKERACPSDVLIPENTASNVETDEN